MPDARVIPDISVLRRLPYLNAFTKTLYRTEELDFLDYFALFCRYSAMDLR